VPGRGPLGRIESATYLGSRMEYAVSTGFGALLVSTPITADAFTPGACVGLRLSGAVRTETGEGGR
jgi:hypothetical protein